MHFICEGDVQSVFEGFARRRDDIAAGRTPSRTPIKMIMPGGIGGAPGMGLAKGFVQAGLIRCAAAVAGNSVGLAAAAYAVAADMDADTDAINKAASIFYEECAQPGMVSYRRWIAGGNLIDLDRLGEVLQGVTGKGLNEELLRASPVEVIGAVTQVTPEHRVRNRLFELKNLPVIKHGILASALMPGAITNWKQISDESGGWLVDGGCTSLLPIRKLVARYQPTDILVFMNRSITPSWGLLQKILEPLYVTRGLPERLRTAILTREAVLKRRLDFLRRRCGANWLLIYNDPDLDMLEQDPKVLRDAVDSGCEFMTHLIKKASI